MYGKAHGVRPRALQFFGRKRKIAVGAATAAEKDPCFGEPLYRRKERKMKKFFNGRKERAARRKPSFAFFSWNDTGAAMTALTRGLHPTGETVRKP